MKLSDFILLNGEEKKKALLHHGVLVSKRRVPGFIVFLFQLQNFYAEACFDSGRKELKEVRMFGHTALLEPYLDGIRIDELLD